MLVKETVPNNNNAFMV